VGGSTGGTALQLNLLSLSKAELEELVQSWGQPKYRAKQILEWVLDKGVRSYDDMANLPKALRQLLEEHTTLGSLTCEAEQISKDGTTKRAYALADGSLIESVLMPYQDGRRTACISSQAGCGMGCKFCATGQMGFVRHLSATEIFEQAQVLSAELQQRDERLSNVVFMGMGEPLANYDNVLEAARRINTELGIGARHITISTVGIVPKILKLAREPSQFTLAVSLHEATDEGRSSIMPINRRYNIDELLGACREYTAITGRRVTFEWALIHGSNDQPQVAHGLGKLLKGMKCHVNIIPLNPTQGFLGKPANPTSLKRFISILESYGVPATSRVRRGIDIDAGCGQLTQKTERTRKAARAEGEAGREGEAERNLVK